MYSFMMEKDLIGTPRRRTTATKTQHPPDKGNADADRARSGLEPAPSPTREAKGEG